MIDGERILEHSGEVVFDFIETGGESCERGQLGGNSRGEGKTGGGRGEGERFDVSEEMLDSNLFRFFSFDGGGDMDECSLR